MAAPNSMEVEVEQGLVGEGDCVWPGLLISSHLNATGGRGGGC